MAILSEVTQLVDGVDVVSAKDIMDTQETAISAITKAGNAEKLAKIGYDMPSNTYETLTWTTSGQKFTAPANGWFYAKATTYGTQHSSITLASSTGMENRSHLYGASDAGLRTLIPVKKGDVITAQFARTVSLVLVFLYAEGEIL